MTATRAPTGPAYDWTEYETVAMPVALAFAVTVAHVESLVAVQAHARSDGVTVKNPEPPLAEKLPPSGFRTNEHAPALCVTAYSANPPDHVTRTEPVLVLIVGFAATVNVRLAEPVPDVVPTVIHGVDVDALHEQASLLVALNVNVPPAAGTFCDATGRVYVQPGARTRTKSSVALFTTVVVLL